MTGRPIAAEPSVVFSGYTLATLMPTKLEEIVAATRERVADAKTSANLPVLSQAAERHQPRRFRHSRLPPGGWRRKLADIGCRRRLSPLLWPAHLRRPSVSADLRDPTGGGRGFRRERGRGCS